VGVFSQERWCANDDIHTVHTCTLAACVSKGPKTPFFRYFESSDYLAQPINKKRRLTSLNSDPGIVHVASDVGQDLGPLETHLTDSLAVRPWLGRSSGGSKLDVLNSEVIQSVESAPHAERRHATKGLQAEGQTQIIFMIEWEGDSRPSDLHLGLERKEGVGELFSFSQGRLDDLGLVSRHSYRWA
jgi:hypothetical protein